MTARLTSQWHRWVWGRKVMGLHVHLTDNDAPHVSRMIADNGPKGLEILNAGSDGLSLEDLGSREDGPLPIVTVITGKGVLTKRIPRTVGGEDEQVRQQLAEYVNTRVVHSVAVQGDHLHISILREETAADMLGRLRSAGMEVVALQIGVPVIHDALRLITNATEVTTGHHRIAFDTNGIISVNPDTSSPDTYTLGDDAVSGNMLLPLAAIIGFLHDPAPNADVGPVAGERDSAYHGRAVKKLGLVGIVAVFAVLLVNTLLFMHYHDQRTQLEGEMMEYRDKQAELSALESELQRKRDIVEASGSGTSGRFAFYADRIGATVPSDIGLTLLNVNPVLPRKRAADRIEVRPGIVEVEGTCAKSEQLNSWLEVLRERGEVASLKITGFGKKEGSTLNAFSLELTMHN